MSSVSLRTWAPTTAGAARRSTRAARSGSTGTNQPWAYGFASRVFNNARLQVSAIGQDAANNYTLTSTDRIFRVDATTPTAAVAVPIADSTRTT